MKYKILTLAFLASLTLIQGTSQAYGKSSLELYNEALVVLPAMTATPDELNLLFQNATPLTYADVQNEKGPNWNAKVQLCKHKFSDTSNFNFTGNILYFQGSAENSAGVESGVIRGYTIEFIPQKDNQKVDEYDSTLKAVSKSDILNYFPIIEPGYLFVDTKNSNFPKQTLAPVVKTLDNWQNILKKKGIPYAQMVINSPEITKNIFTSMILEYIDSNDRSKIGVGILQHRYLDKSVVLSKVVSRSFDTTNINSMTSEELFAEMEIYLDTNNSSFSICSWGAKK